MSARVDETPEHPQTEQWKPDQSGTRARPNDAEPIEEIAVELVAEDAPPRPPRRPSRPPPPPLSALVRDRVDLDEIVREVARSSVSVMPTAMPTSYIAAPRTRPSWLTAIVLTTSALLVGASVAVAVLFANGMVGTGRVRGAQVAAQATEPSASAVSLTTIPREDTARAITAHDDEAPAVAIATAQPTAPQAVAIATAPTQPTEHAAEAPSVVSASSPDAAEPPASAANASPTRNARRGRWGRGARTQAAREEPTVAATEPAATPAADAPAASAPESAAAPASPEPTAPALPAHPSRSDVEQAIQSVLPAVRACAPGLGVVALELHFASSGRVTTASVDSNLATPEQRSCMARAARTASVPPFSSPSLTVRYPARL